VGTSGAVAAPPSITIIDLGEFSASGLNNSGLVVGETFSCFPCGPKATVWTQAGGPVSIHDSIGATGNQSHPTAVNDSGEVVGFADVPFSWSEADGGAQIPLPPGLSTSSESRVTDINAAGQFAGHTTAGQESVYVSHAFTGTRAEGIVDLGTLGVGWSSVAWDINDAGEVVGASATIAGDPASCRPTPGFCNREFHAFYWSESDGMVDLGTLDNALGSISQAIAINESGQVLVNSQTAPQTGQPGDLGPMHAFIWTSGGGMQDLGALGGAGASTQAFDMNNAGQVVGYSGVPNNTHAFIWTQAGGMVDLGTLGGPFSYAWDINDLGQVVGSSQTATGQFHAFLWTPADGMVDLGVLDGFTSSEVTAINENGQIIGRSGPHSVLWEIEPSGQPDADSDGIPDDLDDGQAAPGFTNVVDGKVNPTVGTVTSGSVTVEDHADPTKGVRITAVTDAVLSVCPFPTALEIEIPAGTSLTVTCGSVTLEEVSGGPVTVTIPGTTTAVTFANGSSGTVSTQGGVSVTDVQGDVKLSVGDVTVPVPEGDFNVIPGGMGNSTITGTAGNDMIVDQGGNNTIDGKGGDDSITVSGSGNNAVKGGAGHDHITTGSGNDAIDGGDGNDTIAAGNGNNAVKGGKGDDTLTAGSGNDAIDGGPGTDTCDPGGPPGKNSVKGCELP
jgi:probable HAF family extracellular repeat protein